MASPIKNETLAAAVPGLECRQLVLIEQALARYIEREGVAAASVVVVFFDAINRAAKQAARPSQPINDSLGIPAVKIALREAASQVNREADR